ncbi:hypothetical protein DMUE_3385 [Dictyocoela muelleri]|nr:hypothetical protein DMUE_3385 [Dictyocoela muelleri]
MSKICRIPSFDSLKTAIYQFKAKVFPSSILDESTLDCNWFALPNNRNMLMFSDFSSEKMIIMGDHDYISRFTTKPNLEIVMDGTFRSSSRSFFQLYILYGYMKGQTFPLIYCFLESKTEDTYVKMLTAVKYRLGLRLEPRKIQMDFEYAAFNTIRTVFLDTVISGCSFHFEQAIWRKINRLGLSTLYEECESFRNSVKSITSLALIPIDHIDHCWSYIVENCNVRSVTLNVFFEYVDTKWINPSRPLFNREIWSQYGNLRGRTNNSAEGFNSKLNRAIQKSNPNFWEIVDKIKEI